MLVYDLQCTTASSTEDRSVAPSPSRCSDVQLPLELVFHVSACSHVLLVQTLSVALLEPPEQYITHKRNNSFDTSADVHCVHEKNYNPRQCKIEMSNLNTSKPNCVCLITNVSATELPNFVRKYYLIHEVIIFKH